MRSLILFLAVCCLFSAQGQVFLEESGNATGIGNHSIEIEGNLSYNLSESGEVSAWRVICCNNTGVWEIDL